MEPVFAFPLDLDGEGGRRRTLHEALRGAILDRRILPGAELPSTRKVAAGYGIARNTVIAAYDLLMAEGYLLTRVGARAVVADVAMGKGAAVRLAHPMEDTRLAPAWRAPIWPATRHANDGQPGFYLGMPDCRQFPFDVWRRLLVRASGPASLTSLGYQAPEGRPLLRAGIARHVSFARAVACHADDVVVTSGAQQAFDLLARVLVTPGETRVAVEDPGYPPLRSAMAAAGAQLVPVPVDDQGLCVDRLPDDVRVVCVTPSHQFPAGVAMSMDRRKALLDFARQRGAVVIEDDYDGEFRYGGRPLDALRTLDRDASVLYVGTFSKSLFPALRVGYIVTPPWARDALVSAKQCIDTHGNVQVQDALAHFIAEGHLLRHVRRMRKVYAERRTAMLDVFAAELSPWFEPIASEAGIHLSVRYRDADDAGWMLPHIRRHAPGAQSMSDFGKTTSTASGVSFGFGCIDVDGAVVALRSLAAALAIRR
ncbi:GntR family transcriptional regulator [Luteibacter rhizovicinus]|uniref:GntR family transcriptional regulator n=1 Tax=Luteibacter rhizovicinus TaxID=242606 RepID=A0A4R3YMJ7_9GAMM|nr:PLP-dependent aminotransferase family protein [Luteibacter rhizovicinus]TCV92053.1 GntR family transcriptional regulator [Luteibacter rhizovicinus]